MIISDELRAWIADNRRQAATKRRVDDFARAWSGGEVNRRIESRLACHADAPPEALAEAVAALMAEHGWAEQLVAAIAAEMRRDPFFDPPFRTYRTDIHSGFVLHHDARVSISIGVTDLIGLAAKKSGPRGPASINFTGSISVLKAVSAGGARLSFWEAPAIDGGFTGAGAGRCRKTGERTLEDGEIVIVDGRRQSYVIEHARADMVLMQAALKAGQAPLKVEYDAASGGYVGSSASDDADSRVQMLATFLRKSEAAGAFETLAPLLEGSEFFVRWHVMKELLGIDAARALPLLVRMAEGDPHAEVRRAAAGVLARLRAEHPALREAA